MKTFNTLVSADDLQAHVDDPSWRVFDCRYDLFDHDAGPRAYAAGHIAGVLFVDEERELAGVKDGHNGRHPLPNRDALAERFRSWGVDATTQMVAYDAHGGQFAGRLWWLARWLGHANVALLDGGWQAWLSAGGASSTEQATRRVGNFKPGESLVRLATVDQVMSDLGSGKRVVVDARAPERYSGAQEPIDPAAGHIPGAINRPWQRNLAPDGRFKSATELRSEFDALLGSHGSASITHQCGSGVTACHNLVAMEIAGLPGAELYAGSWSEWVANPDRPIAIGLAP